MNIEISDKTYEFLKTLMTRINTQDNLATASPFYYTVELTKDIAVPPECGDVTKYYYEGESYTEKELEEMCKKDEIDFEGAKWKAQEYDSKRVTEYENFFLTKEGYEEHMKLNGHNYRHSEDKPHYYIKHAFRNPEILQLLDALGEVTGLGHNKH